MGDKISEGMQDISSESCINYKDILNRINGFQKHLKELTKAMKEYNAKNLLAREKSDDVAKCLMKYGTVESLKTTSHYAVQLAAEIIGKIGDHQNAAINRIEKKVIPNLCQYKGICKCLSGEVSNAMIAQSRALSKKKLVKDFSHKANCNPRFRNVTPDAEKEFDNAMAEFSRLTSLSQEQVIKFEHKRLMDLKESLESFFKIEIVKHTKALELLSDGYRFIHSIDENADLDVVKKRLKLNMNMNVSSSGEAI